eukprot:6812567-Prymnesium_polylepis.1
MPTLRLKVNVRQLYLIDYKGPRCTCSDGDLKVSMCISKEAEFAFDSLWSCSPSLGGVYD